jgi:hypothetical protein
VSLSEQPKKHLIHTPCKTDFLDDGHLAVESIPKTLIKPESSPISFWAHAGP